MTLTNICLLAMCFCAMWMLREAAQGEPAALPAGAQEFQSPAYSQQDTLIRTDVLRMDSPWAADLQGEGAYDAFGEPLPAPAAESRPLFSQGVSGLLSPLTPTGAYAANPTGEGVVTEGIRARLPFFNATPQTGLVLPAGPLALDLYAISFTALYSDLATANARAADDGGFLAAVSLQGALTLNFGESAYLGVGFTVYYLPTVNRAGFFFGNGGADTAATFRYDIEAGRWQIAVEDEFRVYHPAADLLGDYEVDEIAVAGRYRFGRVDSLGNRSFFAEDIFFANVASVSAGTRIDEDWCFRVQAGLASIWPASGDIRHGDTIYASAGLFNDVPGSWIMPWLVYNYYDVQRQNLQAHQVSAGASLPFTPTLQGYVRGGWIGLGDDVRSAGRRYLWEMGIVHHLNESVSHSLFGGHNFFITDYGDAFMGSYGRYTLAWRPVDSRWSFSASAQTDKKDLSDATGHVFQGRASLVLDERTSLSFTAASVRYDRAGEVFDRRIYGASLSHSFSPTIRGVLSYQYSDYSTSHGLADFTEHLFYLSLTKSL